MPHVALASPLSDFYIQEALERYFILPQDAKSLATSGSNALHCRGSSCIFLNPAGLGKLRNPEVGTSVGFTVSSGEEFFSEEQFDQNKYRGYLVAAYPMNATPTSDPTYGTLEVGYSRYDGHTNDSIHTTPDGHRRSLAYGISPTDFISLGYGFHFIDDQLHTDLGDLHSHSRLLHVWGFQFDPYENFQFAGAFKLGIGQSDTEDFQFDSNGLSHLRDYTGQIGVQQTLEDDTKLSLLFDYTRVQSRGNLEEVSSENFFGGREEGNVYNIRLGMETEIFSDIILRAGARWAEVESYKFKRKDLSALNGSIQSYGVSAGLGYVIQDAETVIASLDYGIDYLAAGRGTWEHTLSFTLGMK